MGTTAARIIGLLENQVNVIQGEFRMRQGLLFSIIVSTVFCTPVWGFGGDMGVGTEPLTDGSAQYPYLIEDLADFDEFASNSSYWESGVHTKLMTDINLSGRTYTSAAIAPDIDSDSGWDGTEFWGNFDGDGHVVRNLTIDGFYVTIHNYF